MRTTSSQPQKHAALTGSPRKHYLPTLTGQFWSDQEELNTWLDGLSTSKAVPELIGLVNQPKAQIDSQFSHNDGRQIATIKKHFVNKDKEEQYLDKNLIINLLTEKLSLFLIGKEGKETRPGMCTAMQNQLFELIQDRPTSSAVSDEGCMEIHCVWKMGISVLERSLQPA